MDLSKSDEWQKAQRGELFRAFVPELIAARDRCKRACDALNTTQDSSRRNMVELWKGVVNDKRPLPPPAPTQEEDDALFEDEPWVYGPLRADYGSVYLGSGSFVNFNATFVDPCPIRVGARTLIGPNCSFYSGTHPLDPVLRNGTSGPEMGKDINIGEDCWIAGNCIVLPGVAIGNGSTVGAGSVVTKDVPPYHVVAGNPARVLRRIEPPDSSRVVESVPA